MPSFTFDLNDPRLVKLLVHCQKNFKHHRECYPKDPSNPEPVYAPSIMLVKDEGAYLMSPFTKPGAPESARLTEPDGKKTKLHVVYADGCGPDDEWIGGDDFGETLPFVNDMIRARDEGHTTAIFKVTQNTITLTTR